jgi:predicted nuclease of predicted toxin-antitoxin system
MRILVDENLGHAYAAALNADGHEAISTAQHYRGLSDVELCKAAARDRRAILTEDVGFADSLAVLAGENAGVILLRLHRLPAASRITHVIASFRKLPETMSGLVAVIEPSRMRMLPVALLPPKLAQE